MKQIHLSVVTLRSKSFKLVETQVKKWHVDIKAVQKDEFLEIEIVKDFKAELFTGNWSKTRV